MRNRPALRATDTKLVNVAEPDDVVSHQSQSPRPYGLRFCRTLSVLDRAVIAALVTKGTGVYDEELKPSIERLFQDIIDRLKAQDSDDQEMPSTDEVNLLESGTSNS